MTLTTFDYFCRWFIEGWPTCARPPPPLASTSEIGWMVHVLCTFSTNACSVSSSRKRKSRVGALGSKSNSSYKNTNSGWSSSAPIATPGAALTESLNGGEQDVVIGLGCRC